MQSQALLSETECLNLQHKKVKTKMQGYTRGKGGGQIGKQKRVSKQSRPMCRVENEHLPANGR